MNINRESRIATQVDDVNGASQAASVGTSSESCFIRADDMPLDQQKYFFKNPSSINQIGDPFIIRDQKTGIYSLVATSAPNGYYGWRSKDLVHWDERHWMYQRPDDAWSINCYWAPEIVYYNHRYYMFYTARHEKGSLLISVAVSDHSDGPYVDLTDEPAFDFGYAIIDASVFIDDDGRIYFYYTRDVSENVEDNGQHVSVIYGVELNTDMKSVKGEPKEMIRPEQSWEIPHEPWTWNEGPIVTKHAHLYYLAYSANMFESPAYSVGYATSKSPLGPWTKAEENPILTAGSLQKVSGSGHHSYVYAPNGSELWTAYHTHTYPEQPSGNRQLALDRVIFSSDGKMHVAGPSMSWIPVPSNDTVRTLTQDNFTKITSGSHTNLLRLVDGIWALHPQDETHNVEIKVLNEDSVRINFQLDRPHTLAAVACVAGAGHVTNIARMKLHFGDTVIEMGAFEAHDVTDHTFAGAFSRVTTDHVGLELYPVDSQYPVVLSEVYLIEEIR